MPDTDSATYVMTAPGLIGVWAFDPTDVDATVRNFPYADGRSETIMPTADVIQLAGREDPIVEFGEVTLVGLDLTVFVPFDSDHDAAVQWWRDRANNRRVILYRDNRGRLLYGALPDGIKMTDGRMGTAFAVKLQRVTYSPVI